MNKKGPLRKIPSAGEPPLRLAVHPLFWVSGIYFCLTGRLFVFLLLTLSALEHECAHAFAAARRGYALNRVVLMPYGAVVRGDIGGISLRDEIAVAAAGPLVSGATALGFVALPAAYFAYLIPCILLYMVLATSLKKAYVRHYGELL